jgi:hypothetical protein
MNKEKISTEKERKRINCVMQKLTANERRRKAEIDNNVKDKER